MSEYDQVIEEYIEYWSLQTQLEIDYLFERAKLERQRAEWWRVYEQTGILVRYDRKASEEIQIGRQS